MNKLGFFTPVQYEGPKTLKFRVREGIEDYFYLNGKTAKILQGKSQGNNHIVELKDAERHDGKSYVLTAVKVISYMTILIPLIMLCAKAAFRSQDSFHLHPCTSAMVNKKQAEAKKGPVAELMNQYTQAWNSETKAFDFPADAFQLERFTQHLNQHAQQFNRPAVNLQEHYGYIEKIDLDPAKKPRIYMRADLHGDLKSLIENLRSLQDQGLLDAHFKCAPGVQLVFLGDYCDRGNYGTYILELFMRLREENPEQVHLIRGNHEYVATNHLYGRCDPELQQVIDSDEARKALESFYETMSLTTYFSVKHGKKREYIQCTHGLFELTTDAAPLLDDVKSRAYLAVSKERTLSDRVRKIADCGGELAASAKRIDEIVHGYEDVEKDMTIYNWGDVHQVATRTQPLGGRWFHLNPQDVRHYLNVSSVHHRVEMLFRGHEHGFQHHMHDGKVIATTLPVGMDCPGYQNRYEQPDRAYLITPAAKVDKWSKRAILRERGRDRTDEITAAFPLTSSAI